MRINKYLAQAGLGSRRKVEELIVNGKVKVNGKVVKELATDIKETDVVSCDNKPIKQTEKLVYYKLHKPKGYVTTVSDEKERKTVMDLMRGVHYRVYPVGRLDYETEGLLIMTNDGNITNLLTKPNSEIKKVYIVHIESDITKDEVKKLSSGVDIGGYTTKPCSVELLDTSEKLSKLKVTITEGKNRQVRKMCEAIGKRVLALHRVRIGNLGVKDLKIGQWRFLKKNEVEILLKDV